MPIVWKGVLRVLRVTDLDRALAFYRDVLGFELRWRQPADGGGESCMLEQGAARVMLSTGSHAYRALRSCAHQNPGPPVKLGNATRVDQARHPACKDEVVVYEFRGNPTREVPGENLVRKNRVEEASRPGGCRWRRRS